MNQLRALAWKEWRESRAYLFIGLGIFLGLPLIGEMESVVHTNRRFEIDASTWVLAFGGVLAVIVAVAGTCRDVNGRLEDFWRSRPVSVARWFLVKYVVGLLTVLASCMVPIAVELIFNRDKQALQVLIWYPFLWAAIFSIGFLAGCIVRKTAQAATLALAGLLLIYMVPVIVPPLEWLNTAQITDRYWYLDSRVVFGQAQILFASGMFALAISGLALALLVIHCNWHVESGRNTIYGLVASALLLLFASAAFQLGTNLPVLQTITLPQDERIEVIRFNGAKGSVLSFRSRPDDNMHFRGGGYSSRDQHLRTFEVTPGGINLSAPVANAPAPGFDPLVDNQPWQNVVSYQACSLSPEVSCRVNEIYPPDVKQFDNDTPRTMELNLFDALTGQPIRNIRLWEARDQTEQGVCMHVWDNRLFAIGKEMMEFDIHDPRQPRLISTVSLSTPYHRGELISGYIAQPQPHLLLPLPALPGLPKQERLKILVEDYFAFDGKTVILWTSTGLASYHLGTLTDTTAAFDLTGEFAPSFLERTFGFYRGWQPDQLQNGLLYHTDGGRSDLFNSAISVFDTQGPHPMQRVGHFAAPGASMVQPLQDGRAVAGGGNKLYLIGPPPRH